MSAMVGMRRMERGRERRKKRVDSEKKRSRWVEVI